MGAWGVAGASNAAIPWHTHKSALPQVRSRHKRSEEAHLPGDQPGAVLHANGMFYMSGDVDDARAPVTGAVLGVIQHFHHNLYCTRRETCHLKHMIDC